PFDIFNTKSREIAARDFIARSFAAKAERYSLSTAGGKNGQISIERHSHELLETNAVVIGNEIIEIRFTVQLPVKFGKISCGDAVELFMRRVPGIIHDCLLFRNLDGEKLANWIETNEDADYIRNYLPERGLVAFIADGSIFKIHGGGKLKDPEPFRSPDELAVTFDVPNRGEIRGMGIPAGITVLNGGFSQGKSTFLQAIELGVYNHIYGDGREFIITVPDAVSIRVEEGRRVENVDISPFISTKTGLFDAKNYSTPHAAPAASMAANIIEALEIGTSFLLFDDETIVSNFTGRDARLQALIPKNSEPFTSLLDNLPLLRDKHGISSIVVGASGDYFDIADTVIIMNNYKPSVMTEEAKKIAREQPTGRTNESKETFPIPSGRSPLNHSLEPPKSKGSESARPPGKRFVQYGDEFIDVSYVSQLVNQSQSRAISRGIAMVYKLMDGSQSLKDAVTKVMKRVETIGLDALSNRLMGDLASFRAHELAAAINRMRKLKVK
ncbi:P-loop domain-containing protein, partial [Candidatus Latescibacterota bacterium]